MDCRGSHLSQEECQDLYADGEMMRRQRGEDEVQNKGQVWGQQGKVGVLAEESLEDGHLEG